MVTDTELGHTAIRVYTFLSLGVGQGAVTRVGQRLIAKKIGMDRGTVVAAIAELVSRGHITVAAAKPGSRQAYVLNSLVFAQKQGKHTEIVSAPSGGYRYASIDRQEIA